MDKSIAKVDLRRFTENLENLEGSKERQVFETVMTAKTVEDLLKADITAEQVFSCMKSMKTLTAQLEQNVLTAEIMFEKMKTVVSSGKRRVLL